MDFLELLNFSKIGKIEKEIKDGTIGKSAYTSAVEGGYKGTEEEFYADLGAISGLAQELEDLL